MTPQKSDKWIPWYFVAFFVFLAIADGVFVYLAVSTHTGVVKEQAYEKGLDYNEVVAAKQTQDALGWHSELMLDGKEITATLADTQNTPLKEAEVKVYFARPTQDGHDFAISLAAQADGRYTAPVSFPLKGQWDATLTAIWKQKHYQNRQRIVVR